MRAALVAIGLGLVGAGCAATSAVGAPGGPSFELFAGGRDLTRSGRGALRVQWQKELNPSRRGNYRPVEGAVAALDAQRGNVYVGAASGRLAAFSFEGRELYRFELHEPIESEPALDVGADELYVGTERGELYAFTASTGKLRWKADTGAALREKPVLFRDAVYVINEEDVVESRSRADGSLLWSYKRERADGFLVAGHSGLALTEDGRLLAGFNDGAVLALDALDGRAQWVRDTSLDVPDAEPGRPRYVDADATPVLVGECVYAASFGGGLYCLDEGNGSVVWRAPEWTGITSLVPTHDGDLILVSADHGVVRIDLETRAALWIKPNERGAFGVPELFDDLLVVGDSKGSLIALDAQTGEELGRIDAGHGFAGRAALAAGRGFVLTNGGSLYAMRIAGKPVAPTHSLRQP